MASWHEIVKPGVNNAPSEGGDAYLASTIESEGKKVGYTSAMSYMKKIAGTGLTNNGAFRNTLQHTSSSAGGVGTLAGNLSNLRDEKFYQLQRLKYGAISPDSELGKKLLGDSNDLSKGQDYVRLTSVTKWLTDNFTNLGIAMLGGSGAAGNSTTSEVIDIAKAAFKAGKEVYKSTKDVLKRMLWKDPEDKSADASITAGKGNANSQANFLDTLFEAALNESKDKTAMEEYKNDIDAIKAEAAGSDDSWVKRGGEIVSNTYNTAATFIKNTFAIAMTMAGNIFQNPGQMLAEAFKFGFSTNVILQASDIIGGKMLSYCLGVTNVWGGNQSLSISLLRSRVMNMPPAMTNIIDPNSRCYNNNVIACQHVLTIIPGILDCEGFKFFSSFGISNAAIATELAAFEAGDEGSLIFDAASALASIVDLSDRKNRRIGQFRPQTRQYLRVVTTILGHLQTRLSPSSSIAINLDHTSIKTSGWGGIELALGTNTNVNESGSNTMQESVFDSILGSVGASVRNIKAMKATVLGGAPDEESSKGGQLSAVLDGQKTNLPKFWENSDFNRSYTMTFRLESPYGDTESVLNYVYKPFAALLAISLPIYKSMYGFGSPFMVRMDCPGWFSIDTGYVTSIDFRRAPDEGTWNANGLATAIEVTISVQDIYNSLALSVGPTSLSNNFTESSFLDSIAGMDYKEIYSGGSMASRLRDRVIALRNLPNQYAAGFTASASRAAWGFTPGSLLGFPSKLR